ncbi:MAG TPA: NAD(P)H-hydrate dehydratase, partial [Psychrobacter sp.]|nr:NAD(P)H-hydrate dehydratase [Psychrobacter sp.]
MDMQTNSFSKNTMPIRLYSSEQLYAMEQAWFAQGNDSFGLMQQAAWQMAQHIETLYENKCRNKKSSVQEITSRPYARQRRASIWVGKGNNGGDGWLIAYYLQQMGWQVQVIMVGFDKDDSNKDDS